MLYRSHRSSLRKHTYHYFFDRISILKIGIIFFFLIILGRLFQLQILDYHEYSTYAEQRMKDKIITARRGRILLKDGENKYFELANNVSLELLFADPYLIQEKITEKQKLQMENSERAAKLYAPSPSEISSLLAPILFSMIKEQASSCDRDQFCIINALENAFFAEKRFLEKENIKKQQLLNPDIKIPDPILKTEIELLEEYKQDLTEALSKTQKDFVLLKTGVGNQIIEEIKKLSLPGIGTTESTVFANPFSISSVEGAAKLLEPLLEIPVKDLEYLISKRRNRYHKIKNKIDFETAEKIRDLNITGLGFYEEHWRNYAEQEGHPFAPQLIGFLDNAFNSIYGIEKSMNEVLSGKTGHIRGEVDLRGRTLTARSSSIEQAINGTDIVLTIDQVIQNKVEELLQKQVKASQARSGEVIIQDPSTGAVLALAIYPGFNPNHPGSAYERESIDLMPEQIKNLETVVIDGEDHYFLYLNPGYKIEIFKSGEKKFLQYKNREGIGVYRNPTVSNIYEPGSVFKAIVMAAAIDSQEVKPSDTFQDNAPLKVDCHFVGSGTQRKEICDYTIKNSTNTYYGLVTMTQVLEKSLNTGMAFVSKKLGPNLLYDYLSNFGFGEKTYVELPDEHSGKLPHYRNWVSESDMITKAFGQGIAVTPIQLVTAFSAIINGGLLMQPTITAGTLDEEGRFIKNENKIVRRVISAHSSEIIKSMLISSVERGVAKRSAIDGYKVGGKTGTSQIATKGLYEKGEGSTIASFAGFAPYENPRFVMLVKIDRPRTSIWGETNAVPLFKEIATFILDYLQIPPDNIEE